MGEPMRKVTTVGNNGQISIGKSMAGKEVQVEQLEDGRIVITPGIFVPAHQTAFFTEKAQKRLADFNKHEDANPPSETDLAAFTAKMRKKRGKRT